MHLQTTRPYKDYTVSVHEYDYVFFFKDLFIYK